MATENFKRKLTTILSADVVDYSRLIDEDEAGTVKTLETYKGVMFSLIRQHRGQVVDSPGDNLLAEFGSVVDAVQCGVSIQKELQARNMELAEDSRMNFRIGINLGDVIEEQDRIYGDGVTIAARLEALADPGGICISKAAFDYIENKLPFGYRFIGEQNVKNIFKPIGAYKVLMETWLIDQGEEQKANRGSKDISFWRKKSVLSIGIIVILVIVAGLFWDFFLHDTSIQQSSVEPEQEAVASDVNEAPKTNAVLPFDNLSSNHEQALWNKLSANIIPLYQKGRYSEAIKVAKEALQLAETIFDPDHPNVATSLYHLAGLYKVTGDYANAEPLLKRSLAIREKVLGPDHLDVGTCLNLLATLYQGIGDYANAEPLLMRSVEIAEKAFGPDNPDVATSLNNLALLYQTQGKYVEAESLYKRSLDIREKTLGPDHPNVATSLNNLAALYKIQGKYIEAEPLYKRSLAIKKKAFGPDHPNVTVSLNNLAVLYEEMGDYASAEPLYKRSLEIAEKALGPDNPDVATRLNNLALLYQTQGKYVEAESLYKRSLEIGEKALGPDHPDVAGRLNNLAGLYMKMGSYASAEPLFKRSLASMEKALGPDHPNVATCLSNLALFYQGIGDYANAEPLFMRSLEIEEKALGPDHPNVATSLNNLAKIYAAKDNFNKAHSLFVRTQSIDEKLIDQVMGFVSEDRQTLFLTARQGNLEIALNLVAMHLKEDPSARKIALDIWLRRKGIVLETQRRFQEALMYSDDPKAVSTFQKLAKIRSQLSQLVFRGLGEDKPEVYQKKIVDLEIQKSDLEAKLSSLSQAYALKKKIEKADSTKVAEALPKKTVLLEFVRIRTYDFKQKGSKNLWLPPHYIAFLLHAGKGDRVEMVDLGEAEEIDKVITQFKKELGASMGSNAIRAMKTSRKLHDLVFDPLRKALDDVKEIFISPDGNMNLIPFEVLQEPNGKFLIEDYTFNYLAAGRDILGFGEIREKGSSALLMGDPDFDLGTERKASTLRKLNLAPGESEGMTRGSSDMRDFSFQRLPGTREEVEIIKDLLGNDDVDLYTGEEALEEILKQKGTPLLLHLATHGFFLSDQPLPDLNEEGIRSFQIVGIDGPIKKGVTIKNPLLRSGIALAGANNALSSGNAGKSDGIVTAEKILGLRLRGTDMVVLSACETGLGEVKSGEGVYGLRRAFIQSGAKSLVMSMWSVPDRETKELMVEFYKNIQSGGMNRSQALRQAELKQMQVVKERYGHTNPICWGAFVFLGVSADLKLI